MSERYVGKVISNNDPDKEGKCQIYVEHLMSGFQPSQYQWFRQDKEFTSFIPENNDLVWCYFEDELASRQGYYQEKVTLKSYHTHNQTIGSITSVYPDVKYIKLANGISIAMSSNSSKPEISIYHPSAEIFIDKDGNVNIKAANEEIKMDATGITITATGKQIKMSATAGTPNGKGVFCALPGGACLFTGAVITTDIATGA